MEVIKPIKNVRNRLGQLLIWMFHTVALFLIGAAVIFAAGKAFFNMFVTGHFSIEDILLLFIYVELGAMVGIYFKTDRMPVRFLIYVAITALTRMLIAIINADHQANVNILYVAGAILILGMTSLLLRYGSYNMPLDTGIDEMNDHAPLKRDHSQKED